MKKKQLLFWLKIFLTIISFTCAIIFKSNINWSDWSKNYIDIVLVKEILYDLSIGVFSAMILVWFIDEINEKLQEKQAINNELIAIKNFDNVLQIYIQQYIKMFYCVVTPLSERKFDNVEMPEQFSIKDMRNLHQTSLLITDGISSGSIDSFLQIELSLREEFRRLLEKYNFEHYPVFTEIFMQYIQVSLKYDCRAALLETTKRIQVDQELSKFINDLLENHADDYYQKILNGEHIGGNIAFSYMLLYEMMREERRIILDYQKEIEKITITDLSPKNRQPKKTPI